MKEERKTNKYFTKRKQSIITNFLMRTSLSKLREIRKKIIIGFLKAIRRY